jgi:AcrR family transcriptional regulator
MTTESHPEERPSQAPKTPELLIEVAGRLFAERGVAVTGKEICQAAGVNLAAINYHFGSKDELYGRCLDEAHSRFMALDEVRDIVSSRLEPEEKIAQFIGHFVERLFSTSPEHWHVKLLVNEMAVPSRFLDRVVERQIRPKSLLLRSIIAEMLGLDPEHPTVRFCAQNVISLCISPFKFRHVFARLFPDQAMGPETARAHAEQLTDFVLGGLRAMQPPK